MTNRENWCIVGGGVLGLTLAHRLAGEGRSITLFEASNILGGLADAWDVGGVKWDRHYHVTLSSDQHLRALLAELGLESALRWTTTRTDFYSNGRFDPLNNALDYLRFPLLGIIDKMRLAATILYASRLEDGRALEHIPVETWLTKISGRRTYETIWRPLLRAKLGENYKHASAAFIWAIIRRLYAARRSGLKTEMFGYIVGGYARVFERLESILKDEGVQCVVNSPVSMIARGEGKVVVRTLASDYEFDRVVVTAAAPIAARMCASLTPGEKSALNGIVYQGIVCASILLTRPLRGAYITYIADDKMPFTAVIEMSALVDSAQFGGRSLAYLPCYVTSDDPIFEESNEQIEQRFRAGLTRMYPDLAPSDILAVKISRVHQVLAVATLDYTSRLPPITTSVPGLFIVNSAHIVNGTLNVNETVNLANKMVPTLLGKAA
jgi:protoporphyrinogen oxidase